MRKEPALRLTEWLGRVLRLRTLPIILATALATGLATERPALAQNEEILLLPRDTFRERGHQEGNRISFCYHAEGMMADFELDLAEELGAALLTEVRMVPLPRNAMPTPPFDHRISIPTPHLYIVLAERCAAIIGFALSSNQPDWLLVTRPYMDASMVLVSNDPSITRLEDLPLDRPIGTRGLSVADNRLINYLQARPESQRWRRMPYFSNDLVLERLDDGTVGLGLVWEPALNYMTDGNPGAAGYHILPRIPFPSPPIQIGIAVRETDTYLSTLLGDAIEALVADGTVDRLLQQHRLLSNDGEFLEVPADG